MTLIKHICLFIFLATVKTASAQVDSLLKIINSQPNDSMKVMRFHEYGYNFLHEPVKALELTSEMVKFSAGIKDDKLRAFCLRKIGVVYGKLHYYDKALDYTFQAAAIFEKMNDEEGLVNCYNNIGNYYNSQGEYTKDKLYFDRAINYHLKCIELRHKVDTNQLHNSYNNIGNAYMSVGDFTTALHYYNKAYPVYARRNDENGINMATLNMGDAYLRMAKAEKNSKLREEHFKRARAYYQKVLEKHKSDKVNERQNEALIKIGQILCETGHADQGIQYLVKGYEGGLALQNNVGVLEATEQLIKFYQASGDIKKANFYWNIYNKVKDSLVNAESLSSMEQMQALYQSTQKDREIEKLGQDKKLQEERLHRNRIIIFSTIGGLLLLVITAVVLLSRYNLKKKANLQLKDAYTKIEIKNKQITDSIVYAKRLQAAILPPETHLKKYLPGFFMYYAPRDIVSGDFYWITHHKDKTFFAVADCTGHGVPGALMSTIGNTLLHQAVNQKNIHDPGQILSELDKGISEALRQNNTDIFTQEDGMDISICCIDMNEKQTFTYAAANHSIFIKTNDKVVELHGDIYSIGGAGGEKQFVTKTYTATSPSYIVMSTDGYYDQFGGVHNRKFLISRFEETVLKADLSKGNEIFRQTFEDWKKDQKQTDDVLVAGFRL